MSGNGLIGVLPLLVLWSCQGVPGEGGGDAGGDTDTTDTGSDSVDTDTGPHEHTIPGQYHWHTFLCAESCVEDMYVAAGLDAEDNIYVAKGSCDDSIIVSSRKGFAAQKGIVAGPSVEKLDPEGQSVWRFVLPEEACEFPTQVYGMAVGPAGECYVTGYSSCFWTGPNGEAPIYGEPGEEDDWYTFILKVTAEGEYAWHQLWADTELHGLAERGGALYALGSSNSLWDGPDGSPPRYEPDGTAGYGFDFIMQLDGSGEYLWHTFVGEGRGTPTDIAIDQDGKLFLTGLACLPWQGPEGEDPRNEYAGFPCGEYSNQTAEAVVVALSGEGEYAWHAFYGKENSWDSGLKIVVAPDGDLVVAGMSQSEEINGWAGPGGQAPLNDPDDVLSTFVLRLRGDAWYLWHTFPLSGPAGGAEVATSEGEVYVTSATTEDWDWVGGQNPIYDPPGDLNTAVLSLDPDGAYLWHSFFGYGGADEALYGPFPEAADTPWAVLRDSTGHLVVVGRSIGEWPGVLGQDPIDPFCYTNADEPIPSHFVLKIGAGL